MKKKCAVTQGLVHLEKYAKFDTFWKSIKIAAPARRALVDRKLFKLSDLKKISEKDLKSLHGMGPNALKIIKKEMKKKQISFKI
ncbi:MAG: hypothetical protein EBV27_02995 [Actinobacteria bacterium]|nr:hypothetical protein [Actinomycetota bacterium]